MGLYDGIKDAAKVIQKADNIELYEKLLDLSAQALELQNDNARLIEENKKLKQKEDICGRVVRHEDTYITLKDDNDEIMYCSCCWDSSNKLIQVRKDDAGYFLCHLCKNRDYYDKQKYMRSISTPETIVF